MVLHYDPRTKCIVLFMVVICTLFFPSLEWEGAWIVVIGLFGALNGKGKRSMIWSCIYFLFYFLWKANISSENAVSHATFIAWLSLVFKVFPCCMLSGIMIRTTKINEFLTAMNQSHVPKQVVIPLAVLLRYLPTVKEDWGYIKAAMRLRGVPLSLTGFIKQPGLTLECLYVPLLITASKTADELTIASVTRGIENPEKRTSIHTLRFRLFDMVTIFVSGVFMIMTIYKGVIKS